MERVFFSIQSGDRENQVPLNVTLHFTTAAWFFSVDKMALLLAKLQHEFSRELDVSIESQRSKR